MSQYTIRQITSTAGVELDRSNDAALFAAFKTHGGTVLEVTDKSVLLGFLTSTDREMFRIEATKLGAMFE